MLLLVDDDDPAAAVAGDSATNGGRWAGDRTRSSSDWTMAHLHPHCSASMRAGAADECCGPRIASVRCGRLVTPPIAVRDVRCAGRTAGCCSDRRDAAPFSLEAEAHGAAGSAHSSQITHCECECDPTTSDARCPNERGADWPSSSRRCRRSLLVAAADYPLISEPQSRWPRRRITRTRLVCRGFAGWMGRG